MVPFLWTSINKVGLRKGGYVRMFFVPPLPSLKLRHAVNKSSKVVPTIQPVQPTSIPKVDRVVDPKNVYKHALSK